MSGATAAAALVRPRTATLAALALAIAAAAWLAASAAPTPPEGSGRQFFGLWRTRHIVVALAALWIGAALVCAAWDRKTLARFVLVHAALACGWIALELLGLAGIVAWGRLLGAQAPDQMGGARTPNVALSGTAREDLAVSWNLDSAPIPFRFVTDRHGFRNEPDRESAEIYCLGDSILVGGLLPHSELVSARLEALSGHSVMNVALVGLGPEEEAELLRTSGLPLAGRLVLHFVFEGNDLSDCARARGTRALAVPSRLESTLLNQLVLAVQRWTQPVPAFVPRRTGWIGAVAYRFQWLRNSFEGLEGELEPIAATLALLRRDVEAAGGRYALVLVPTKIRVLGALCRFEAGSPLADWERQCGPLPERVRAWAEAEGVPCLDLTDALRAAARGGDVPWFPADTHWNASGHRVAAEELARFEPVADLDPEVAPR